MEQYWNRETDKLFENALAKFPEECPDRWERIAEEVPGATKEMVLQRNQELVDDVAAIEKGKVPIPSYPDHCKMNEEHKVDDDEQGTKKERRVEKEER